MSLALGVDTGGTYTDAVLIRDEERVIASAKSLTTRHDLAEGIGGAVAAVLEQSGVKPSEITLASLSTTLATNALVEGQGGRVALVLIGFRDADMDKHGLREALAGDPYVVLEGGHTHAGGEKAPLDEVGLLDWLTAQGDGVSGFAVAAQFATRNPAHEQEALRLIKEATGKPVTCSHHLSSKLNGPKRALTAILNARLIGMIDGLITRAETRLTELGVTAPMMVVRGDGALISADFARERPIETILSGPAASIVGARWMTKADLALVSDIGGTTTDVCLLTDGRPAIDPDGARVGPFRTMVEAVAMRTTGLGGDSEVHFVSEGLKGGVTLGPRRVLPVSLAAVEAPELVHDTLDKQLNAATPGDHDARFLRKVRGQVPVGLEPREADLYERIEDGIHPIGAVLRNRLDGKALRKLVERGLVQISGLTPSDASHALGKTDAWDKDAAEKALLLMGRRRTGSGNPLAQSAQQMAQIIVDQLTNQTKWALLETAFAEEDADFGESNLALARNALLQAGLSGHRGILKLDAGLNLPVIGLGASASAYYPAVGDALNCDMILPQHAGVANAIGAVVGQVTIRRRGTVTSPSEGLYRVHLDADPEDFGSSDAAMTRLEDWLREGALADAQSAGAEGIQVSAQRDVKMAQAENRDVFIEAEILVEASGRPRIAAE